MAAQQDEVPIAFRDAKRLISFALGLWVFNQIWMALYGSQRFNLEPVESRHRIAHFYTAISLTLCCLLNIMAFSFAQKDSMRMGAMILGTCNLLSGCNYWLTTAGAPARIVGAAGQPVYISRSLIWISSTMCQAFFISAAARRGTWEGYKQCGRCVIMLLCGLAWDLTDGRESFLYLSISSLAFADLVRVVHLQINAAIKADDDAHLDSGKKPFMTGAALRLVKQEFTVAWSLIPAVQVASRYGFLDWDTGEFANCALDHISKVLTCYIMLGNTTAAGITSRSALKSFVNRLVTFVGQGDEGMDGSLVTPEMVVEELRLDSDVADWLTSEFAVSFPKMKAVGKPGTRSRQSSKGQIAVAAAAAAPLTPLAMRDPKPEMDESFKTGPKMEAKGSDFVPDVGSVLDKLEDWEYDAIHSPENEALNVLHGIFIRSGMTKHFNVPQQTLSAFLDAVLEGYQPSPYHNWRHAVMVTHTLYLLLEQSHVNFTPLERGAALISAICHDLGHNGMNNAYHVNSRSALATKYNDVSVLENYHAHACFEILYQPETNLLAQLSYEDFMQVRRLVISNILGTDMSLHAEHMEHLDILHEELGGPADHCDLDQTQRQHLLKAMLHSADLYHQMKPWPIAREWAGHVQQEFNHQTQVEEAEGLPWQSFMRVDSQAGLAKGQNGFISFVLLPWWRTIAKVLPVARKCVGMIEANLVKWNELAVALEEDAKKK